MTPITTLPALAAFLHSTACQVSCAIALSGTFPAIEIENLPAHGPISIDATAATIVGLRIDSEYDITVTGGHYGPNPKGTGIWFVRGTNYHLTGAVISQVATGWAAYLVNGFEADHNRVTLSTGDCGDLYGVQHGHAHHNLCMDNIPTPTHPDGVQVASVYSSAGAPLPGGLVTDVEADHNFAAGDMQCVTIFEHYTPAATNVRFHDNVCLTTMPTAEAMDGVTGGSIVNDHTYTLPGGNPAWRASIYTVGSTAITQTGNTIDGKAP